MGVEANRCPQLDEIKPSTKKKVEEDAAIVVVVVVMVEAKAKRGRGKKGCVCPSVATFGFKGTGPYVPLEGLPSLFRNGRRRRRRIPRNSKLTPRYKRSQTNSSHENHLVLRIFFFLSTALNLLFSNHKEPVL